MVSNGSKLFDQFQCEKTNTLEIQMDEGVSNFEFKKIQMGFQFNNKNWEIWWSFIPMEFPELN